MPQVNTGVVERRQLDVNPNSPTFGQYRWHPDGINLTLCPISSVYQSARIAETVYRSDCGAGTSTGALYAFPVGYISDSTNQSDVDARARIEFDSTKAAYALAHCTCSSLPASPEVWVREYNYLSGPQAVLITFERSDTFGNPVISFTYSVNGVISSDVCQIMSGQYTADIQEQVSIAGVVVVDTVFIDSVSPANYTIRP